MSQHIGDVEITAITNVDDNQTEEQTEIDALGVDRPIVVEHNPELEELGIETAHIQSIHSENKSIDGQRQDALSLLQKPIPTCSFDYLEYTGWLSVSDVDISRSGDTANLRYGSLGSQYFPDGAYQQGQKYVYHGSGNSFNVDPGRTIALPQGVEDVMLRSATHDQELSISPIGTLGTEDGTLDIYQPYPKLTEGTVNSSESLDVTTATTESYQLTAQNDYVQFDDNGQRITDKYQLQLRIADDNVTDDISIEVEIDDGTGYSTVHSETTTTDGSGYVLYETDGFVVEQYDNVRVTVLKDTSNTNTIKLDYVRLAPSTRVHVTFNNPLNDFNLPNRDHTVKLWDDNGTPGDSTQWSRVHNLDHKWEGDPVVGNGILRMKLSSGEIQYHTSSWQAYVAGNRDSMTVNRYAVREYSQDKCVVRLECDNRGTLYRIDYTFRRGSPNVVGEVLDDSGSHLTFHLEGFYSNYAEVDKLYNESDYSDTSVNWNGNNTWVVGLKAGQSHLGVFSGDYNNTYFNSTGDEVSDWDSAVGSKVIFGILPNTTNSYHIDNSPPTSTGDVAYHTYEAGTDLPHGKYLIGWRIKSSGGENVSISTEVAGSNVAFDGKGNPWTTATTTSFDYYLRYFETDTDGTFRSEVTSGTPSAITVDEVIMIPLNTDDHTGVQDISHDSLTEIDSEAIIRERL